MHPALLKPVKMLNLDLGRAAGKQSELERSIRQLVNSLQVSAEGALSQTECIVKAHLTFSNIMAKRFQSAAQEGYILKSAPEVIQIAESIRDHSAAMSQHIEIMCCDLSDLTKKLEQAKRKDKTLKGRIMRWLARAFDALSFALGVVGGVTTFFAPPVGAVLLGSAIVCGASSVFFSLNDKNSE
jgi:hypothetical protein